MPPLALVQEDAHTYAARAVSHPSSLALIAARVEFWQYLTPRDPQPNLHSNTSLQGSQLVKRMTIDLALNHGIVILH